MAWNRQQAFENKGVKRNAIAISLVFYNISHFLANEIFSVGPFIMLEIGAGCSEKLTRFLPSRLLNWELETGNRELENSERRGSGLGARTGDTKPREANGLNTLTSNEIGQK